MKQYETYKDSGIQWLGKIPSHWMPQKMKYTCQITDGTHFSPSTTDVGMPYITVSNVHDNIIDVENANRISLEDYNILVSQGCQPQLGDVLLAKDGTVGRTAIVINDNEYVVLSSLGILHPMSGMSSAFLKYSLDSIYLQEQMNAAMAGSALRRITISKINEFLLLVPSIKEQQTIASYLDYKVGQIDGAIKEKEAMLEDLKAYRTAIISEAVTKGLDKNVEMKDSGVEWIGMIPKHWGICKLKALADVQTGNTPSTSVDKYWENPTEEWYTPSDFDDFEIQLKSSSRKLSTVAFKEEACRVFYANTVLIVGIGATLGKVGISTKDCSANQQINAISFREEVLPLFGAYYLFSIKDAMKAVANAATLAIMNQSLTKDLPFVLPPFKEQTRIVEAIDNKTSKITCCITNLQSQITDLKSYKSSVISEAVTGKVDLREWKNETAIV